MKKIKYYKDTHYSVGRYALHRMLNIFGVATPLKRISDYFKYPQWAIEEWIENGEIPDDEALPIICSITKAIILRNM